MRHHVAQLARSWGRCLAHQQGATTSATWRGGCGGSRALSRDAVSLSDFDFEVPPELVAQVPADPRDSARLMVLHRQSGEIEHRRFYELPEILSPTHLVVMNNTRVVNCKLQVMSATSNQPARPAVLYLLKQVSSSVWEVSGDEAYEALKQGSTFTIPGCSGLSGTILKQDDADGVAQASFVGQGDMKSALERAASVPLPPYITDQSGEGGYQTVYAKEDGSVAAPTAGEGNAGLMLLWTIPDVGVPPQRLHFTDRVFNRMKQRGISRAELTLHVGYGTFGHVHAEDLSSHKMHAEAFSLSEETAATINSHRQRGHPLLSVGTTSTRVLESIATLDGTIPAYSGETDIFIRPGYKFKAVDALLTNFHMPRLTPIMLVASFAGYDLTMRAYREAISQRYRFFSFGDSMLIL